MIQVTPELSERIAAKKAEWQAAKGKNGRQIGLLACHTCKNFGVWNETKIEERKRKMWMKESEGFTAGILEVPFKARVTYRYASPIRKLKDGTFVHDSCHRDAKPKTTFTVEWLKEDA